MFLVGLLLWLSAALPTEVTGFPHGAPCAAADTLLPNDVYHGYTQDISVSTPPYVLEVLDSTGAPVTMYKRGQIVTGEWQTRSEIEEADN